MTNAEGGDDGRTHRVGGLENEINVRGYNVMKNCNKIKINFKHLHARLCRIKGEPNSSTIGGGVYERVRLCGRESNKGGCDCAVAMQQPG